MAKKLITKVMMWRAPQAFTAKDAKIAKKISPQISQMNADLDLKFHRKGRKGRKEKGRRI